MSVHQSFVDNYFDLVSISLKDFPLQDDNELTLFDIIYLEEQINLDENGKRNRENEEEDEEIFSNKKHKII